MSARGILRAAPASSFQSSFWDDRLRHLFSKIRGFAAKVDQSLSRTSLLLDCEAILLFRKNNPGYQGERALMHAGHGGKRICALRWAGALSDSHVVGLFLHEFGHLKGGSSEPSSNEWVKIKLGIRIDYKGPLDLQWVDPDVVRKIIG